MIMFNQSLNTEFGEFLVEVAKIWGTPAYLYNFNVLDEATQCLLNTIPKKHTLLYSLKANPHSTIVRHLVESGCHLEISSLGELKIAQKAANPSTQILASGPGKCDGFLKESLRDPRVTLSVESATELMRIADLGNRPEVLLRLNPPHQGGGAGLHMTGTPSAFGIDPDGLAHCADLLVNGLPVSVIGFHCYQGSNLPDIATIVDVAHAAVQAIKKAAHILNIQPRMVSLGGGFPAPYAKEGTLFFSKELKSELMKIHRALNKILSSDGEICWESGRSITGTCGTLLSKVLDVKKSHGIKHLILDTGINHLGGMSGLGRVAPLNAQFQFFTKEGQPISAENLSASTGVVAGPLCTPLDRLNRKLPLETISPGDLAIVPNVGAYGLSASLIAFLSHPIPVEILHRNGSVLQATRLELQSEPSMPLVEAACNNL